MGKTEKATRYLLNTSRPSGAKSSVHYGNYTRYDKAKEQSELPAKNIKDIIMYTNDFLKLIGLDVIDENKVELFGKELCELYKKIKEDNQLKNQADIVWMKFTTDGFLGVVATSNDINFDIPSSEKEYNDKCRYKWKYNTSGIIIHHLKKKWNESFVLVFPLKNMPEEKKRGDIERGIGNYLIEKGVPILDFYSHRY